MKDFKKNQKNFKKMSDMSNPGTSDGEPDTAFDMVNFYGTYEIQPTAATPNEYPAIAQGFNKGIITSDRQNTNIKRKMGNQDRSK